MPMGGKFWWATVHSGEWLGKLMPNSMRRQKLLWGQCKKKRYIIIENHKAGGVYFKWFWGWYEKYTNPLNYRFIWVCCYGTAQSSWTAKTLAGYFWLWNYFFGLFRLAFLLGICRGDKCFLSSSKTGVLNKLTLEPLGIAWEKMLVAFLWQFYGIEKI